MIKDAFGTEVKVEDLLVYAVRQGSSMWLKQIRVLSVNEDGVTGYDPLDINQRKRTLRQMNTTVVLESNHAPV